MIRALGLGALLANAQSSTPKPDEPVETEDLTAMMEAEAAELEAEATDGAGNPIPSDATIETDYMFRCMAMGHGSDMPEDLTTKGHFLLAPNGLDYSMDIGAFTTGNIPGPIARDLQHGPPELGLDNLQALHFRVKVILPVTTEGEVQLSFTAAGTNFPGICIKDTFLNVMALAKGAAEQAGAPPMDTLVEEGEAEAEKGGQAMAEHIAQVIRVWPDPGFENVRVCGLDRLIGGPECATVASDEDGMPKKFSFADRHGACGMYFQGWNVDPAPMEEVGAGTFSTEEPICSGGATVEQLMTMVNPATVGLAQKLAAHSAGVLSLAQTTPHVLGLFKQGKALKAAMMKQQIFSFSSGLLVATLVGVLALKFGRKPAYGAEVSQHDDENPTSRPMLEQAE
jgi:hypothetical protein